MRAAWLLTCIRAAQTRRIVQCSAQVVLAPPMLSSSPFVAAPVHTMCGAITAGPCTAPLPAAAPSRVKSRDLAARCCRGWLAGWLPTSCWAWGAWGTREMPGMMRPPCSRARQERGWSA